MNNGFERKVVVISGATGSLGKEAARQFASSGAKLVLVSHDSQLMEQTKKELNLDPENVQWLTLDLLQSQNSQLAAQKTISRFGRADILLHLVGGWTGGKEISEVEASEVSQMLNQHLWTTFHMAQAFSPIFIANGWGRFIVVSSPLAVNPVGKMLPYSIGKAAQETLILTLAKELKGNGVTANIIQVKTIDIHGEKFTNPSKENASWSTPQEIMAAISYLCSSQANTINGARMPLFGT